MTTTMALLSSSPTPTFSTKPHTSHHSLLYNKPTKTHLSLRASSSENGAGGLTVEATPPTVTSTEDAVVVVSTPPPKMERSEDSVGPIEEVGALAGAKKFKDVKWINGTWDLKQFVSNGVTNWDAVIDAEAKRRKWLETYPESTTNNEPVIFDTSIIPWWAWIKRFHLPEAELLNGRAAMIGFFMSYFVDSLTGVGLVDQMSNFFCKTLLFVAVLGVLFIRKNEDVEKLKKLLDETTFYDKQWQATWQEDIKKD